MNAKQVLKQIIGMSGVFSVYLGCYWVVRVLFVSLLTYISIGPGTKIGDLSDAVSTHELTIASLGAIIFIFGSMALYPLVVLPRSQFMQRTYFFPYYFRSMAQGAWIALVFCVLFAILNVYRYLGFFIHYEGAPFALLGLLSRIGFLVGMIYCDEYFFREQILGKYLYQGKSVLALAAIVSSLFLVVLRKIQFDIGWMHSITLFLIGVRLSLFRIKQQSFIHGAGWLTGILVMFHVFFGLPIFGVEFPGILLLKYSEPLHSSRFDILMTGSLGGPLSSLLLQGYLLSTILWQARRKNSMMKS